MQIGHTDPVIVMAIDRQHPCSEQSSDRALLRRLFWPTGGVRGQHPMQPHAYHCHFLHLKLVHHQVTPAARFSRQDRGHHAARSSLWRPIGIHSAHIESAHACGECSPQAAARIMPAHSIRCQQQAAEATPATSSQHSCPFVRGRRHKGAQGGSGAGRADRHAAQCQVAAGGAQLAARAVACWAHDAWACNGWRQQPHRFHAHGKAASRNASPPAACCILAAVPTSSLQLVPMAAGTTPFDCTAAAVHARLLLPFDQHKHCNALKNIHPSHLPHMLPCTTAGG